VPEPAIRIDNLGKSYRITGGQARYHTFRESIIDAARAPFRRGRATTRDFWALKDVSFEVRPGEVVGVIGRNGAGKSTLLKLLSRITKPTTGRIELNGRVGSLLEVGTGFHPELTGRENVFLNGAILGMSRREIRSKFDEIVAFAEVEQFLDTPVKRYSSGMYVRLAFAVAAHLEPEILILDEVLAVGDAAFQKKCHAKIQSVATGGTTALLVSHNAASIEMLCDKVAYLSNGQLAYEGEVTEGLKLYGNYAGEPGQASAADRTDRRGVGDVRFTSVTFDDASTPGDAPLTRRDARIRVELRAATADAARRGGKCDVRVFIRNHMAELLTTLSTESSTADMTPSGTRLVVEFVIERLQLVPGRYRIDLWCMNAEGEQDYLMDAATVDVQAGIDRLEEFPPVRTNTHLHGFLVLPYQVSAYT
jgi:lipopolysaccharide transport system ATP-binding protein